MPENDEYQLTLVQRVHETRVTNVFNYMQTSGDGIGDAKNALADGFRALAVMTTLQIQMGTAWSALCAEVRQLNNQGQDFFRVLYPGVIGGGGPTLNPATALQCVHYPSNSGPGQQGSVYLSGAPVAAESRNNLTNAAYDSFLALSAEFLETVDNQNFTFVMGLPSRPFIAADPGADPPIKGQTALPFRHFVLADVRVPLTKIRSRRLNTRC
ncbi:unnamed protein product [marine sediment metagenome]|uniref:Uncharacterized protein n=1 Tax=marine sediment metagenome TaxID=412755 RepID=X0ZVC6_9ZZZZ